jgi:hypothetical protein
VTKYYFGFVIGIANNIGSYLKDTAVSAKERFLEWWQHTWFKVAFLVFSAGTIVSLAYAISKVVDKRKKKAMMNTYKALESMEQSISKKDELTPQAYNIAANAATVLRETEGYFHIVTALTKLLSLGAVFLGLGRIRDIVNILRLADGIESVRKQVKKMSDRDKKITLSIMGMIILAFIVWKYDLHKSFWNWLTNSTPAPETTQQSFGGAFAEYSLDRLEQLIVNEVAVYEKMAKQGAPPEHLAHQASKIKALKNCLAWERGEAVMPSELLTQVEQTYKANGLDFNKAKQNQTRLALKKQAQEVEQTSLDVQAKRMARFPSPAAVARKTSRPTQPQAKSKAKVARQRMKAKANALKKKLNLSQYEYKFYHNADSGERRDVTDFAYDQIRQGKYENVVRAGFEIWKVTSRGEELVSDGDLELDQEEQILQEEYEYIRSRFTEEEFDDLMERRFGGDPRERLDTFDDEDIERTVTEWEEDNLPENDEDQSLSKQRLPRATRNMDLDIPSGERGAKVNKVRRPDIFGGILPKPGASLRDPAKKRAPAKAPTGVLKEPPAEAQIRLPNTEPQSASILNERLLATTALMLDSKDTPVGNVAIVGAALYTAWHNLVELKLREGGMERAKLYFKSKNKAYPLACFYFERVVHSGEPLDLAVAMLKGDLASFGNALSFAKSAGRTFPLTASAMPVRVTSELRDTASVTLTGVTKCEATHTLKAIGDTQAGDSGCAWFHANVTDESKCIIGIHSRGRNTPTVSDVVAIDCTDVGVRGAMDRAFKASAKKTVASAVPISPFSL